MAALIIILVLAFIGVLISAFMAGGSEKRKNALLWGAGGVLLSALTGGALFFCKGAIKGILLKQNPHLSFMAENINIPWQIILQLGLTFFSAALFFFCGASTAGKILQNGIGRYCGLWELLFSQGICFFCRNITELLRG